MVRSVRYLSTSISKASQSAEPEHYLFTHVAVGRDNDNLLKLPRAEGSPYDDCHGENAHGSDDEAEDSDDWGEEGEEDDEDED